MNYKEYYKNQLEQFGGQIDYKNYYEQQLNGSGFPVFAGYPNQRGHGLGGFFKQLYNWFVPIVKTHAIPFLKKGGEIVGNEVIKSATNVANDAIAGKNIKNSAQENFTNSLNNLSQKATESLKGRGYKRKRKISLKTFKPKKFKQRRLIDVFDTS